MALTTQITPNMSYKKRSKMKTSSVSYLKGWCTQGVYSLIEVSSIETAALMMRKIIHRTFSLKQQSPRTSLSQHCSVEPSIYLLHQMIFPETKVGIQVSH